MPVCRLCPQAAGLLGLLLLSLLVGPGEGSGERPTTQKAQSGRGLSTGAGDKPGVCPELEAGSNCTEECVSDSDCADNRKCCQAGCSSICSTPNEKPGSCPSVDLPQLGICEDQCQIDSQCPGNMKCCRNGCGKVSCVTPRF